LGNSKPRNPQCGSFSVSFAMPTANEQELIICGSDRNTIFK
jgi:hypothetical protein